MRRHACAAERPDYWGVRRVTPIGHGGQLKKPTFEVEEMPTIAPGKFYVVALRRVSTGNYVSKFYMGEFDRKDEAHALADALKENIENPPASRRRTQWS